MSYSKSSPKPTNKTSFKQVSPFELFFQLTYLSAMAASGMPRSKLFLLAAQSSSPAATYFAAVNTLVEEMRYDYPEACRRIGLDAPSENMKSFLLRLSDALRSGEPMGEYMAREAEAQGEEYENRYERDMEALKQWSNAFSSIIISVALIVIIQVISSMISSLNSQMMLGLVSSGTMMAGFGAWIIQRSAPRETIIIAGPEGSTEHRRSARYARMLLPIAVTSAMILNLIGVDLGWILILVSVLMLPIGVTSMRGDSRVTKKDTEFSTFLRSLGGMATSSGTTLKGALVKIDLSSFPALEADVNRLSKRLQALVEPDVCWEKFGKETGSRLISDVVGIFFGAIKIGGDPERVGYLCSLFTAKTVQLRAKRRLNSSTFAGLTAVMHAVIAGLMVFVLSIVTNFATTIQTLMPEETDEAMSGQSMSMGMANFSPEDLQFLSTITIVMILALALIGTAAVTMTDGGYKLKGLLFGALSIFISGVSLLVVPPVVSSILTI